MSSLRRWWHWVVMAVLLCLWLSALRNKFELADEIGRSYHGEVMLQAVDGATKEPLPMKLTFPTTGKGQRWPRQMIFSGIGGVRSKQQFTWMAVEDVQVIVGAEGYEPQNVILGRGSPNEIQVALKRRAGAATQ